MKKFSSKDVDAMERVRPVIALHYSDALKYLFPELYYIAMPLLGISFVAICMLLIVLGGLECTTIP